MTKVDELYGDNGLMVELIDNAVTEDGNLTGFTDRGKAIIREIADYSRSRLINKETKEQQEEYRNRGMTASEVYMDMIAKIANAPFGIYGEMAVILLMPILDELVNGKEDS